MTSARRAPRSASDGRARESADSRATASAAGSLELQRTIEQPFGRRDERRQVFEAERPDARDGAGRPLDEQRSGRMPPDRRSRRQTANRLVPGEEGQHAGAARLSREPSGLAAVYETREQAA